MRGSLVGARCLHVKNISRPVGNKCERKMREGKCVLLALFWQLFGLTFHVPCTRAPRVHISR